MPTPTPPGVPTGLRVSDAGQDFIEWTWLAVEGADGYRAQFSENVAFTDSDEIIDRSADQLSYRREALPAESAGHLRVQALLRSGDQTIASDWSDPVAGTTIVTPPPAVPTPMPPRVPTGLRVSEAGRDFIEWAWLAVEGADGYRAQFSENVAFTDSDEIIDRSADQLSYRREGLPAESAGHLRVQALLRSGDQTIVSDWSDSVAGTTIVASAGLVLTPEDLSLTEGEEARLSIRLAARPTAPVTVAVSIQGVIRRNDITIASGSRLSFDETNWNVDQHVVLIPEHDSDGSDEREVIYLDTTSDDSAYELLPRRVLEVEIEDDDPFDLYIWHSGGSGRGLAPGTTVTTGLGLGAAPSGDVTVTTTSSDPGVVAVTGGELLRFTTDNFSVPQPVSLTVADDPPTDSVTITYEARGGGYDGVVSGGEVFLTPSEDTKRLVLSREVVSVVEGGSARFDVRLSARPTADVIVTVRSVDKDAVAVSGGATGGDRCFLYDVETCIDITFAPRDWDERQTVTVAGVQDADSDDETAIIFLSTSSVDDDYGAYDHNIVVEVRDDDALAQQRR